MILHTATTLPARIDRAFFHGILSLSLCGLAVSLLSSCMAPSRAGERPPAQAETEIPYESMAASIAVGDPEKALQDYDSAFKEKPRSRQTRVLHARLLMIAGNYDEAREELEILLAEDDEDTDVLYNLSIIEGLQGDQKAQKEYLQKVVDIDPMHADALSALGDLALTDKDVSRASGYFQRALQSDPVNFTALLGQGSICNQGKEYQKAVDILSKAIEVQPDYSFSYVDRARAKSALGDAQGAIQDISRAIELEPGYSWSYIDRGRLYIQAGKQDQALEDFSIAIKLAPDIFLPYAMRAEIYYQRDAIDEALADFKKLLSLKPDYYFAYDPLGVLLYMKGDWPGARKAFQEAYRYSPDDHSYALLAGLTLRREGKPKQAADYLQSLLKLIPRESLYFEVARFLMDPASVDFSLTTRLNAEKNKTLRARMLFYVVEQSLLDGKVGSARSFLLDIENAGAPSVPETRLSRWELEKLTGKE
jgi:tetratricopeptide (TPR) repeat protein